jgi:3-oxoacyl-[acyl-carrier protein] reductase
MATNLDGEFFTAQAVARVMVEKGIKGAIVNTSSNSSVKAITNIAPYPISKAAIAMMTQVMALELAPYGIRVNAFGPGTTVTRITEGTRSDPERNAAFLKKMPFKRYGEVSEAVSLALFLASDEASFISGQNVIEDSGFNLS